MINPLTFIKARRTNFDIWVSSDDHNGIVPNEIQLASSQIDGEVWDIGLKLGDMIRPDEEGDSVYQAYINQYNVLSEHSYSDFYHFKGNHDSPKDTSNVYFNKYCSPFDSDNSLFTDKPYPVTGTSDAYYTTIGNMLILCIGDYNNGAQPGGEAGLGSGSLNFRASGNITTDQWNFLKNTVQNNTDKIIILCTHQGIKDTLIGTGWKEFNQAFSRNENFDPTGTYNQDDSDRMGYIAYINNTEGTINTSTGDSDATNEIKTWFESYGQYIDVCLSGHYHRKIGDEWNGRTRYEQKYGTHFLNCSVMNSQLHLFYSGLLELKSNFLRIRGSEMIVETYIHKDPNGVLPVGYYDAEKITIPLKRKFIL